MLTPGRQAHGAQEPSGLRQGVRLPQPPNEQRHGDVFQRRKLRQQVVKLIDEAEVTVARQRSIPVGQGEGVHGAPAHRPRIRAVQRPQQVQQRALPRSGLAENGEALPSGNGQGEVLQNR